MNANFASVLRSSFGIVIGMFVFYLFFKTAPYLLVAGAAVFAYFKISAKIRSWKAGRQNDVVQEEKLGEEAFDKKFDFNAKKVIDVEYYDVK
ncbi:MAG: hypothetical protein H6Q58_2148 [Firmicutes bacterium]|nr:hypothetical protein [Bacillota bacterium]